MFIFIFNFRASSRCFPASYFREVYLDAVPLTGHNFNLTKDQTFHCLLCVSFSCTADSAYRATPVLALRKTFPPSASLQDQNFNGRARNLARGPSPKISLSGFSLFHVPLAGASRFSRHRWDRAVVPICLVPESETLNYLSGRPVSSFEVLFAAESCAGSYR